MPLNPNDIIYFNRRIADNPIFWARFGGRPSLQGARVLDVGCGFGNLCIDVAEAGASEVVGLDINENVIKFAQENLRKNYRHLQSIITFSQQDLQVFSGGDFDIIVSKDAFEHIIDLESMIAAMKDRLKSGGRIYTGFGPLYNSPYGDHGTVRLPVPFSKKYFPWSHKLLGLEKSLRRIDKRWKGIPVYTLADVGLNGYGFADYMRIFEQSGLRIVYLEVNASDKKLSKLFSLFRRIPFLTELFTHNIYCILEKQ